MIGELQYPDWETAGRERKSAEEKRNSILKALNTMQENKNAADQNAAAKDAEIKLLKERLGRLEKEKSASKQSLELALEQNEFSSAEEMKAYAVSEESLEETEKLISEFGQERAANERLLGDAEKAAEGKEKVNIDSLQELCGKLKEEAERIRGKHSRGEHRLETNREKRKSILDRRKEYEEARKESTVCRTLYNLVKGTTGNGKITLEQYIQAAGFDGIIAAANRRLLPMSGGQYELYRQEDSLGKRSNTFLDLEVLDHYTGHRRPVGNLSGGESFKASLSLALGLSDTVSSNLGGVQMDALFIDEGFGSLDRKSIESAMEILSALTGSNKLVGVISHREELMENIPQQIKVKKTREGSEITIESGV